MVEVGDYVLAKDEKTGESSYKKVLSCIITHPTELFHITYKDEVGEAYILNTTGEHPFFVSDKGWVTARELSIADQLQKPDGPTIAISEIITEKADDGETFTTYNFAVEDYHTYYVLPEGKTDGNSAVWVHNNCQIEWASHGYKHFPKKNVSWKNTIKGTKSGPAKYKHGIDIKNLEIKVYSKGHSVTNGKSWKVYKFDDIIGASEGLPSRWVRVEESAGFIHGHLITELEYKKLLD